jgi:hypothetical protein
MSEDAPVSAPSAVSEPESVSDARQERWLRFLDTATVLAVLSGGLYYFGWQYYSGFYSQFGIEVRSLNIDTASFIRAAFETLIPTLVVITLCTQGFSFKRLQPPETFWIAFSHNLLVVTTIVLLYIELLPFAGWYGISFIVSLYVIAALISKAKISILYFYLGGAWQLRLALVWTIIALLGTFSEADGINDARDLMHGDSDDSSQINLVMRDAESWFNGRTFLLVAHEDSLYYLIEEQPSEQNDPMVYVVPVTDVEFAVMNSG